MLLANFILAMLPIIWLIVALSILKMAGHKACVIALIITIILALSYWKMCTGEMLSATLEGVLNALWPICLVIVAALFTYNLSLKTGGMEVIKKMLAGVSNDKRIVALIIGWGFSCFMEGMAGFGTSVAIPAAMMAGIGFDPIASVVACLVASSLPTAFGSVGVATVTLSSLTGLDVVSLSGTVAIIQLIITILLPFFVITISCGGFKALKGIFPIAILASAGFALPQFIIAKFVGAELPDIIGAIISIVFILLGVKLFHKKTDPKYSITGEEELEVGSSPATRGDMLKAASPYILIFVLLLLTSKLCMPIHNLIAGIKTSVQVYTGPNPNTLSFSWINTPGIMIFISAVIGGFIQGAKAKEMIIIFAQTMKKYWKTIVTICSVMALAKIMGYSGMINDITLLLVVATGTKFPIISPLIGGIGGFVTGSGTSTCVLFGQLQANTALSLGLNPQWMAAANVMGAGIGKMISPQGIAIGAGAIGAVGSESRILKWAIKYFILLVVIGGAICFIGSLMGL